VHILLFGRVLHRSSFLELAWSKWDKEDSWGAIRFIFICAATQATPGFAIARSETPTRDLSLFTELTTWKFHVTLPTSALAVASTSRTVLKSTIPSCSILLCGPRVRRVIQSLIQGKLFLFSDESEFFFRTFFFFFLFRKISFLARRYLNTVWTLL
jgi:hypothetical protein